MFIYTLFYLQHSPLVYPFEAIISGYLPIYKSCSFIKGKPTITSTTLQERHDNDKIESHNHNEHLLLYKEAKIFLSSFGRFLECQKWNTLVITKALVLCLIYMHSCLCYNLYICTHYGASCIRIYQAKHSCLCYNLYITRFLAYIVHTSYCAIGFEVMLIEALRQEVEEQKIILVQCS